MNGESTVRGIFVNDPNYPIIDCTTNMFVGTYQNGAYIFEYQNAQLSDFASYRIDSDSAYNDFSRFQLSCDPFYPNDVMEASVLHDLLGVVIVQLCYFWIWKKVLSFAIYRLKLRFVMHHVRMIVLM